MVPPPGEILIVGQTDVGKRALMGRLLHSKTSEGGGPLKQPQQWNLDTKYYTAQVVVDCQTLTDEAASAAAICGGLVLVFAADQQSSFNAVKDWVEQLPSDVADVRLCIANKIDKLLKHSCHCEQPAVQRTPLLDQAVQWCADNLFEYVEVSSTEPEVDQYLVCEEQQQGVKRVKEALEAHMWPGLTMKSKQMQQGKPALPATHETTATHEGPGTGHEPEQNQAQFTSDSDSDGHLVEALHCTEEGEFDQLDKMFQELRTTRDMMQGMQLHERHDAAANAAMRLAAVLGLDDESSSEE